MGTYQVGASLARALVPLVSGRCTRRSGRARRIMAGAAVDGARGLARPACGTQIRAREALGAAKRAQSEITVSKIDTAWPMIHTRIDRAIVHLELHGDAPGTLQVMALQAAERGALARSWRQ